LTAKTTVLAIRCEFLNKSLYEDCKKLEFPVSSGKQPERNCICIDKTIVTICGRHTETKVLR